MGDAPDEFWGCDGRAGRASAWTLGLGVAVLLWLGAIPGTAVDSTYPGQFADRRVGICNGQLCCSTRTPAGVTPPLLEDVVHPWLPVVIHRPMESNRAGYRMVTIPLWPLLAGVGWPVGRWLAAEWAGRYRLWRNASRGGFEPVVPVDGAAFSEASEAPVPVEPCEARGGPSGAAPTAATRG